MTNLFWNRIIKESISNVDIKSYLAYLIDDGFTIYKRMVY
jgi:hypothetical protein